MRYSYLEPLEARIAPATLSVTSITVDEGDEGTVNKTIQVHVQLDTPSSSTDGFDVNYTVGVAGDTATADQQFSLPGGPTGTLHFDQNAVDRTFDVVINGNTTFDPDTFFSVHLDPASTVPSDVTISPTDGKVTIWDDDRTIDFDATSIDQHVNEGGPSTGGHFTYTPTLSRAADHDITVTFKTQDGTGFGSATTQGAAADYTGVTTTLTFAAGHLTPTVGTATVNINGDNLPGPDETFTASMAFANTDGTANSAGPFGAKLGTVTTTSTIVNDDDGSQVVPLTVKLQTATLSTSEGATPAFTFVLSRLSESSVDIVYHTSDGLTHTAIAGMDYDTPTGAASIVADLTTSVAVKINTDTHVESAEDFRLTLDSASVNGVNIDLGDTTVTTATIAADPLPQLLFVKSATDPTVVSGVSVIESTTGSARTADFFVKLGYTKIVNGQLAFDPDHHFDLTEAPSDITFNYATMTGTGTGGATEGVDYVGKTGQLTFDKTSTDGTNAKGFSVAINSDTLVENNETFTVKLSNAVGATFLNDTAIGTILDSTIDLKVANVGVPEGNVGSDGLVGTTTSLFTLILAKPVPVGYTLMVDYRTANIVDGDGHVVAGGAIDAADGNSPQDYRPVALTDSIHSVTFAEGSTLQTIGIDVFGDNAIEGNETFHLQILDAKLVPTTGTAASADVTLKDGVLEDVTNGDGVTMKTTVVTTTGTILDDDGHAITASLTAGAATQAEGAGTTANFNVHLSNSYASAITLTYLLTQIAPDPLDATKTKTTTSTVTKTIDPYMQDYTIGVDYTNDAIVTHDQSVTVTLVSLKTQDATDKTTRITPSVTAKTAKTTILEDDFYVRISDKSQDEGDSGTKAMSFAVDLIDYAGMPVKILDHAVTVAYSTHDVEGVNGATSTGAGADYVARSGTLVFPAKTGTLAAADVSKTIDITINGDTAVPVIPAAADGTPAADQNEHFTVQLGTVTGAKIYTTTAPDPNDSTMQVTTVHTSATGTIVNDDETDGPVLTVVPLAPGVEVDAAHGIVGSPATFTIQLSKATEQPVTFTYGTQILTTSASGGDLASPTDFTKVGADPEDPTDTTSTPVMGTIAAGSTSTVVSVNVTADGSNENVEAFGLAVSHIVGTTDADTVIAKAEGSIAASNRPTISVGNASVVEGNDGISHLEFTVTLSGATDTNVTFDVETMAAGTGAGFATADTDYVTLVKTPLTFTANGDLTQKVSVDIKGDMTEGEGNETFLLHISNVQNALPATVDAIGTILNDDATFTVPAGVTIAENGETATVHITRTGDLNSAADVTYTTVDNTAVSTGAFTDFVAKTGAIHFAPGDAGQDITIPIIDNDRHEATENFQVKLTGTTNGVLGSDALTTVTITDNDLVPTVSVTAPAAVHETDSGTTAVTFTVTLDHANEADDIALLYSTKDGTAVPGKTGSAKAGEDYIGVIGQQLIIPKGTTSKTFTIQVANDVTFDTKTETFDVTLTRDTTVSDTTSQFATGDSVTATASIIDNDVAPQISVVSSSFNEGDASNITLHLNHPSDQDVTVHYYTIDGTAKAGLDYTGATAKMPKTAVIPAGQTTYTITDLASNLDTTPLVEGNETFKVQLVKPVNATLSKTASVATATIIDSDRAYLSINDVSIQEGDNGTKDAIFTVSLLGDTVVPVTVNYATVAGTATAGSDFIATSGLLKLGGIGGVHNAQVVVKVVGDLIKESGDEAFTVALSNPTVATIAKGIGTGTIINDGDSQVTLSVNSVTAVEGSTSGKMTFTVTASDVLANDVTFTVKTSEILKAANVARLGSDFLQVHSATDATKDLVLTIPKNAAGDVTPHSVTFDVTINDDSVFEPTEFFNVKLSNIVGAQPGVVTGTGTIYDNDVLRTNRVFKWTDTDGDIVTAQISKGTFTNNSFFFKNADPNTGVLVPNALGGSTLAELDLVASGNTVAHGNLSITAVQQPNAAGQLIGDGRVNVGYIRANTYDAGPTLLELKGVDLGTVTVDGDVSRISVGDLFSDPALKLLNVYSIGVHSADTEAHPNDATTGLPLVFNSQIVAGATTIKVANDVSGIINVTGGATGRIGTLTIGGALRGTGVDDSGRIGLTGALGKAVIHDIIGGGGARSASLIQYDSTASLGSLTVTGNITAGSGYQSANILFPTIGSVTVGGSMDGGFISASSVLGPVVIKGNLDSGAKILGGGLRDNHAIKSVIVNGNVNNAQILGGYVGQLLTNDTPASGDAVTVKVNGDAQIDNVQIDGSVKALDILAGTDPSQTSATFPDNAALFSRIARVVLNGDILPDPDPNSTTDPKANIAHYISAQSIGTIIVNGVSQTATPNGPGTDLGEGTNFLLQYAPVF